MPWQPNWSSFLLTLEELTAIAFATSRVVMANEAHHGMLRCRRTRRVGKQLVTAAHSLGVTALAMEALWDRGVVAEANDKRSLPAAQVGYLAQPEMRELVQHALDLGWTLFPYEADIAGPPHELAAKGTHTMEFTNWRELEQARNLLAVLGRLNDDEQLLVWCGNGHHSKRRGDDWTPMGYQFVRLAGMEPFCIDQACTVVWPDGRQFLSVTAELENALIKYGGSAGCLPDDVPALGRFPADAFVLSTDNVMD